MASPFVGEIRMMGCNFAPRGNALCNGQIINVSQNTALFSLLGVTYGGNGQTTFALPDLRGRSPMHPGQGTSLTPHVLGEMSGTESVTLLPTEMAGHSHAATCVTAGGNQYSPGGNAWSTDVSGYNFYGPAQAQQGMAAGTISSTGGSQAHNNLQPSGVINFIIATAGSFPSRN